MKTRLWIVFLSVLTAVSCGKVEPAKIKIVGGQNVTEHYPWFVQLMSSKNSPRGLCGGALISQRIVLTAAHCLIEENIESMYVALGMADGKSLHLKKPVKVMGAMIHPQYTPVAERNDIALLLLDSYEGVEFEKAVAPIALDLSSTIDLSKTMRAIGLGEETSVGSYRSAQIQEVDLPMVPQNLCSSKYDINVTQICAGDWTRGGVDTCQGDSGGPLVLKAEDGSWNLAGIVSYGEGCAQKGAPGVYSRVSSFGTWIEESSSKLLTPISSEPTAESLGQLISTKCLYQFNHLDIEERVGDVNYQRTTFGITTQNFSLARADTLPEGEQLQSCAWDAWSRRVKVKWIKSNLMTPAKKVLVVAEVLNQEDGTKQYWVSQPKSLVYRRDVLNCETSKGPVMLLDKRNETLVSIDSVFYKLGKTVRGPVDGQTTWGCSVGESSVEMYEVPTQIGNDLAVRIHHRSVGTVSVGLIRNDKSSDLYGNVVWESPLKGQLTLQNKSRLDLFTWRLACAKPFHVILSDGLQIPSEVEIDSNRYGVTLDATMAVEGSVLAGKEVSFAFGIEQEIPLDSMRCRINRVADVEMLTL